MPLTQCCNNSTDYHCISGPRTECEGGELALVFAACYKSQFLMNVCSLKIEVLFAELHVDEINYLFVIVYRPPSSSITSFTDKLVENLHSLRNEYDRVVCLGDFNIHFNRACTTNVPDFLLTMLSSSLQCNVFEQTHSRGNTLDQVFLSPSLQLESITTEIVSWSDHHLVSFFIKKLSLTNEPVGNGMPLNGTSLHMT